MFPSFDESSSEFNEVSPNYCKYYRAIPKEGGCQFTKEVTLFGLLKYSNSLSILSGAQLSPWVRVCLLPI